MSVTLTGERDNFILDADKPVLDAVLAKRVTKNRDSYIGSNAFGAKVEVSRLYAEEYGVALNEGSWLFPETGGYQRIFTYKIAMSPNDARVMKAEGKLLLICRLAAPWYRQTAYGHDATIDDPQETVIGGNYVQAEPEQLWIFNQKTGEVLYKLSADSMLREQGEQLALNLRESPILLEASTSGSFLLEISTDGGEEKPEVVARGSRHFSAKHQIVIRIDYPNSLSELSLKLNGKPYTPDWNKDSTKIGSYESIRSATVVISATAGQGQ